MRRSGVSSAEWRDRIVSENVRRPDLSSAELGGKTEPGLGVPLSDFPDLLVGIPEPSR